MLERSKRNFAAAEELLNQFRRETNDATQRLDEIDCKMNWLWKIVYV